MAGVAKLLGIKTNKLEIKTYKVVTTDFVGQGAYGVVFKGTDSKKKPIAAKRIDGNLHQRILTQNLDRLLELNHPNVIKIFDIERIDNIFWLFMPYCELGDLDSFYNRGDVSLLMSINVMIQIASGIEYLHSKNVIHRDVKPGNILVASEDPLEVLLTDFDVSKCLDPEVETSLMSSDVGTFAFKSPEFFLKVEPGKIEYHRNVDIYACALTFLAILQAKKGKKRLIPQIETPLDDSEIHTRSIGALIAERIKYKVKERNIVVVVDDKKSTAAIDKIKKLIKKMTSVEPNQRCSAEQVLEELKEVLYTFPVQLAKTASWNSDVNINRMSTTSKGQVIVREEVDEKLRIRIRDRETGAVLTDIACRCDHYISCCICEVPTDDNMILESCCHCNVIRGYNLSNDKAAMVLEPCEAQAMCKGPADSVLVVDSYRKILQLKWNSVQNQLQLVHHIEFDLSFSYAMHYVNKHNIVVLVSRTGTCIEAVKLSDGSVVLKLSRTVGGQTISLNAVTSDSADRIFVSDHRNDRLLVIECLTGTLVQVIEGIENIECINWVESPPQLVVNHDLRTISCYNLPAQFKK